MNINPEFQEPEERHVFFTPPPGEPDWIAFALEFDTSELEKLFEDAFKKQKFDGL